MQALLVDNFDTIIAISSAVISIIALVFTIKAFWLKKGAKITGYIIFCSDIQSEDDYPEEIILNNNKDKSIVINKIFMRFGFNCYLLIEDFGDKPLIIPAFESYKKKYEPIVSYSASANRASINKLIKDKKIKRKIYLSTPEGKIIVSSPKKQWDPIMLCFKNCATHYVEPDRIYYKGNAYGCRTTYLVELKKDGKENILSFTPEDAHLIKYKNIFKGDIIFNETAFDSVEKLTAYFMELKKQNMVEFDEINVIDFQEYLGVNYQINKDKIVEIPKLNVFQYYILGKIVTKIRNKEIKKQNKKRK